MRENGTVCPFGRSFPCPIVCFTSKLDIFALVERSVLEV